MESSIASGPNTAHMVPSSSSSVVRAILVLSSTAGSCRNLGRVNILGVVAMLEADIGKAFIVWAFFC